MVGRDAVRIFSALCMGEIPEKTSSLWVAPKGFKSNVLELINHEIDIQNQS